MNTATARRTGRSSGRVVFATCGWKRRSPVRRSRHSTAFVIPRQRLGPRMDWFLLHGDLKGHSIQVDAHAEGPQYPSDHFPVIARSEYGP
jgi:endonuclease/exonuclease/phosphatase family metal-dependent hydrolase